MPGYQLKQESVAVAGGDDFIIRSLLDRNQFSDPMGVAAALGISSATWPIFGLLWPSGQILAAAMMTYELRDKRVLEIGCGLGLASLVMHRRTADITATDCHPLAGEFLSANALLNDLSPIKYAIGNWADLQTGLGQFDLIVGSDVLYERDELGVLAGFIERHSQDRAEVLIVDPDRGNRSRFNRHMMTNGYVLTESRADCLQDGVPYKGRMLHYWRESRVQHARLA
ncbi:MAG: SAM-dependent methyltransferase [Rhodocyclales bacterium]|nr:SAM-dependent methyltransferase [Rhodocyclales bacterium]